MTTARKINFVATDNPAARGGILHESCSETSVSEQRPVKTAYLAARGRETARLVSKLNRVSE
jgi:hypothetical protein